jgi:hypothetical protein
MLPDFLHFALSMPGSNWELHSKVKPSTPLTAGCTAGKAYLCDTTTSQAQLATNTLADPTLTPTPVAGGTIIVPNALLQPGDNSFIFRCNPSPNGSLGCPSTTLQLLTPSPSGTGYVTLAQQNVNIKPIQQWMTEFSVHQSGTSSPAPAATLISPWADVPATAGNITVLVHGFNVTETAAIKSFPAQLKRLYWVGYPVLDAQVTSSGPAHVVGFAWPGDEGISVNGFPLTAIFYFPQDEFHALQSGVPLAGMFARLKGQNPSAQFNVIANSLGNMVVNSALMQPGMDGVVKGYVMNEAAVPAEAFSKSYPYAPAEKEVMWPSAQQIGYPTDQVWQQEWSDMAAGLPKDPVLGPVYTDLNAWNAKLKLEDPALFPLPQYPLRWTQVRSGEPLPQGASATPQRGPWQGFFSANPGRAKISNTYNSFDQVLGGALALWQASQTVQKPDSSLVGLGNTIPIPPDLHASGDNRQIQFWARLADTGADQEYLWGFNGSHANITRQWAELAYWFGSLSYAAGNEFITGISGNSNFGTQCAGGAGVATSHTYMSDLPYPNVWSCYAQYKQILGQ